MNDINLTGYICKYAGLFCVVIHSPTQIKDYFTLMPTISTDDIGAGNGKSIMLSKIEFNNSVKVLLKYNDIYGIFASRFISLQG